MSYFVALASRKILTARTFNFAHMKESLKKILKKSPIPFTKNHKYDLQTTKIIKKVCTPVSNCIDIGCHTGDILKTILRFAPHGTHYCFEPLPSFYAGLVQHFPATCLFFKIALSNKKGTTHFNHVVTNPAYSGFRPREYARAEEQEEKIEVEIDLLDNIIPAEKKIDFIKIDVEGAEMEVLQGAKATILRNKPLIVFEHGKGAADYYGTRPEALYDFMTLDCDLNVALLSQYLQGRTPLSKSEFIQQFEQRLNYYFIAYP